jgi:uncharacterized protein (TIGR00369 family)
MSRRDNEDAFAMNRTDVDLAILQSRLDRSPFNSWLGLKIASATAEGVVFEMEARPEFISTPERQVVHGGVIASLLDAAAIYAVIAATGVLQSTIDLRVDYHAAARVGKLRGLGAALRLGRNVSSAEARILDADNKMVASGRGVFMNVGMPV